MLEERGFRVPSHGLPQQQYHNNSWEDAPDVEEVVWTLQQRIVMVTSAFFVCILMAGVTVGHIGIREVLVESKDYLCPTSVQMHPDTTCYQNEIILNTLYYSSVIFSHITAYPVGLCLDKIGPRFTSMLGCLIFAIGCIILALSQLNLNYLHYAGYCVMAAGGVFVYVPCLQLCRLLPRLSDFTMALLTCAFDMSAIIFVLLGRLYTALGGRLPMAWILGAYTIVPVIGFILVTSFFPDGDIPPPRKSKLERRNTKNSDTDRMMNGKNLLLRADFWIPAIFTGVMTSRFTSFLANFAITKTSNSNTSEESIKILLRDFSTFYPLGGFISMTAVGQLLQSFSLATNSLVCWILVVFVWSPLCGGGRSEDVQAASALICALLRPYYFTITNQLFERIHGERERLGKVFGMTLVVTAIMNIPSLLETMQSPYVTYFSLFIKYSPLLGGMLPIFLYYRRI